MTDRRVVRTRALLRDALVRLMGEKGWDAVSVQLVCERANVGRSTFYSHFADKEELLLSGFDDLRQTLRELREAAGEPFGFARGLIEHAYENRRLFRALIGRRSGQVVQQRFRQLVLELTEEGLAAAGIAPSPRELAARYIAAGFCDLLIWCIDRPRAMEPAELERLFLALTLPVLARARQL